MPVPSLQDAPTLLSLGLVVTRNRLSENEADVLEGEEQTWAIAASLLCTRAQKKGENHTKVPGEVVLNSLPSLGS